MFGRKAYNRCPVDHEPLVLCELEGIEVDYCPRCGGIWLDRGELDLIATRAGAEPYEPEIVAASCEKSSRRCPRCTQTMQTLAKSNIQIERCRRGHGYWLDRGELEKLVRKDGPSFLADMFRFDIESRK
ncbi:MAG: zf-TFIIB domain-containing protein [Candidatus Sumerlaeia bacterium]